MEATGDTNAPSSGHGHAITPQSRLLRVLMMHGDDIIMSLFDKKLYICLHKVAMVDKEAKDVLRILKEKASVSNMLICEVVDTADNDNKVVQDLIKHIQSQVNIPIKLVSPDSNYARVLNCTSDACRYTSSGPMQYAVEKKRVEADHPQIDHLRSTGVGKGGDDHVPIASTVNDEIVKSSNEGVQKKNSSDSQADVVCSDRPKRRRVIWSPELHQIFVDAVEKLGIENAVPKKILELMNRPDLTRENVASHLQKHRLNMEKQQNGVQVQQNKSGCRRGKFTASNPATGNTMTADRFQLSHNWPEPVIFHTPQLHIHGCDPSSLIFMDDAAHLDHSYFYDDKIDHLMSQGFGWDPQADYPCCMIDNSYGGASGMYWPNNSESVNFVRDGGVLTTGLINESVTQRCLLESDGQLYDKVSYKVPQCNVSPEKNNVCINIGHHHQDNYIAAGIRSYSIEENINNVG